MKRLLIMLLAVGMAAQMQANGDPVAIRSALTLSRNPVAVHVPDVMLMDEHLTVVPSGQYTTVRVEYLLYNGSNRDFKALPYGFPIDYYTDIADRWVGVDGISERLREAGWRDDLVSEVFFTQNGVQLPFMVSNDSVLRPGRPLVSEADFNGDSAAMWDIYENRLDSIGYALYEYECTLMRRWYYVRLDLPAGKAIRLVVGYKVENTSYQRLSMIDSRLPYGYRYRFEYDFSPAAYWGDGHAETFAVDVDARNVDLCGPRYGCADSVPQGLAMNKVGQGLWHYEARRFDIVNAEPLTLDFVSERGNLPVERLFNCRISPDLYTVSISGCDAKYPAANLSDMDLATATVLRPDANDSLYITIRFRHPMRLRDIVFVNGYTQSVALWQGNSRVGSMKVCRKTEGDECIDWIFCKYERRTPGFFTGWNYRYEDLRSEAPRNFTWQGIADAAQTINVGSYSDERLTTEVHFIIGDIEMGRRSSDICISEIILIGD